MKITIAGAGTWGTALGRLLALNGHEVWIWSPFPEETEILDRERKHVHLPDTVIPDSVKFTSDEKEAAEEEAKRRAEEPVQLLREILEAVKKQ